MKLKTKILLTFSAALILCILTAVFGLTYVLDSLSTKMMKKQAENITRFLIYNISSAFRENDKNENEISEYFITAKQVSDESGSFQLKKILLIGSDYRVIAGYPDSETGNSYSSHDDIREAFQKQAFETVVESYKDETGTRTKDIDVVAFFTSPNGIPMVLEVKLDFAESIALLESQYRAIETGGITISLILLTGLLGVLLIMIGKTVVTPVLEVTKAMENVGGGNLEISLKEGGRDEFGLLAVRFNSMVAGLKEKFRLYNYVSQGTINAVRESLTGNQTHGSRRTDAVLFFTDIRGFTSYSETRNPEAVIGLLNRILSLQSDIVRQYNGDVDKFVGDEVMALFPVVEDAVNAAIKIQKTMSALSEELDGLNVGIGIHTGEVMQGDVGSEQMKDYTVIGDNVNTAARLMSVAAGGEILISEAAVRSGKIGRHYRFKSKRSLLLKGKEKPITAYTVAGLKK